jgi:hypothetical protein
MGATALPQVIDLSAPDGGANADATTRKRRRPQRKDLPPAVHIALLCAVIVVALGFLVHHYTSGPPGNAVAGVNNGAAPRAAQPGKPVSVGAARPVPALPAQDADVPLAIGARPAAGVAVQMETQSSDRRPTTENEGIH